MVFSILMSFIVDRSQKKITPEKTLPLFLNSHFSNLKFNDIRKAIHSQQY